MPEGDASWMDAAQGSFWTVFQGIWLALCVHSRSLQPFLSLSPVTPVLPCTTLILGGLCVEWPWYRTLLPRWERNIGERIGETPDFSLHFNVCVSLYMNILVCMCVYIGVCVYWCVCANVVFVRVCECMWRFCACVSMCVYVCLCMTMCESECMF